MLPALSIFLPPFFFFLFSSFFIFYFSLSALWSPENLGEGGNNSAWWRSGLPLRLERSSHRLWLLMARCRGEGARACVREPIRTTAAALAAAAWACPH